MESTAGIAIIGDEILSGKVADENARLLIAELRDLGVRLRRVEIIPDDEPEIAATVTDMSASFDHVFTSGGVGPTHDDVTVHGIALGFGVPVVRHPDLEKRVRDFYKEELGPQHFRLAEVPQGAEVVTGENPSWPVVCFRNIYILPGVPALFRKKFRSVRERFRVSPFYCGRVYCTAEESALAPALSETVERFPDVDFGSYPREGEVDHRVVLTVESKDRAATLAAIDDLTRRLGQVVARTEEPS